MINAAQSFVVAVAAVAAAAAIGIALADASAAPPDRDRVVVAKRAPSAPQPAAPAAT
ncbi:MAG: hypothetical protein JO224_13765 [Pelomonas sp.]|nr:hypothetical protein [Roseateles sp.]